MKKRQKIWIVVLLTLLAAAAVCLLATPAVRKFACKIGAMDMPGESRRVHDHPIPRLGGLALFAGFLAGVLPFTGIDEPVQGILLGSVIIVVTGAVDDLVSLRPWVKLVLQIAAAVVAIRHGVVIRILTNPGDASAEAIALGALSVPVTLLWIVGMTNALNLIDGLDGLATGVSAVIIVIMGAFAYLSGNIIYSDYLNIMYIPGAGELTVFAAALVGALIGFLWYNCYPAQVFMGDTGSLALGGIIAVFALLVRKELLLPLLCGIFLVEAVSTMVQVSYFRYTKHRYGEGRRYFLMAPLHHHYQKKGIPENKIVVRFWIVQILLAAMTLVTLKIR